MDVVNQCLELAACRLSLAGAAASIVSFVPTKVCLSQQLLSQQIFVATNIILSRQAYFCRDKRRVLSRQTRVCRDKGMLVLSRQNFCHDKIMFAATKVLGGVCVYVCAVWQV